MYAPHTQDIIYLLLDLNAGILLYYSNQTFSELLKNSLEDEYVWFMSLWSSSLNTPLFHIKCSAF